MTAARSNRAVWLFIAIWSAAMISFSISSGVRHDYVDYLAQWQLVLSGANPWSTNNAYGPLHNLLALLLPLGTLAPKMLIVGAFTLANACLVREYPPLGRAPAAYVIHSLTITTNVVIISTGYAYGLNDALVAALVVGAVIARRRGAMLWAGAFLGLAVLLKYYPVFLVPLFALEDRRFNRGLIASAAAVMLAGFAITVAIWGSDFWAAVKLGAARDPKFLSILSALKRNPQLFGTEIVDALVRTNTLMVLAVQAVFLQIAWRKRLDWLEASVVGLMVLLLTYKVGHPQFYIPWLVLVAALPSAGTPSARRLAVICLPFALFLSATWFAYLVDLYLDILRNIGFLTLPLGVATVAVFFWLRDDNSLAPRQG